MAYYYCFHFIKIYQKARDDRPRPQSGNVTDNRKFVQKSIDNSWRLFCSTFEFSPSVHPWASQDYCQFSGSSNEKISSNDSRHCCCNRLPNFLTDQEYNTIWVNVGQQKITSSWFVLDQVSNDSILPNIGSEVVVVVVCTVYGKLTCVTGPIRLHHSMK